MLVGEEGRSKERGGGVEDEGEEEFEGGIELEEDEERGGREGEGEEGSRGWLKLRTTRELGEDLPRRRKPPRSDEEDLLESIQLPKLFSGRPRRSRLLGRSQRRLGSLELDGRGRLPASGVFEGSCRSILALDR